MKQNIITYSIISSVALISQVSAIDLVPTFQNEGNKNIVFAAYTGGSSHYNWVLDIGDELVARGHNFTFMTSDEHLKFGKPYKNIKTISSGPGITAVHQELLDNYLKENEKLVMSDIIEKYLDTAYRDFERDYHFTRDYFVESKADVAICDHFCDPCVDAAISLNIPFIVSASEDSTPDSAAPYVNNGMTTMDDPITEFQTFSTRFYNRFIDGLIVLKEMYAPFSKIIKMKKSLGIPAKFEDPAARWGNSIKLINNIRGFAPPRPVGTLVEYVGPIIFKHYDPLTPELKDFLDTHQRVAYVAFGQKATPNTQDVAFILSSLLENLDNGTIDGIIWATVFANKNFPKTITTSSGTTYDFRNDNPHIRFVSWAPQYAVLLHPSTSVFVSHGGLASWFESTYAGKPMVLYPFFADQPGNALTIERSHLGGVLSRDFNVQQGAQLVQSVVEDKDGKIKESVKKYQAYLQIHSRHGISRGADVVEEVAYTHVNGRLPHRETADKRMSYIKANNIDLYAVLILAVSFGFVLFVATVWKVVSFVKKSKNPKIKQI